MREIFLACGGTGGHIFPAFSLAEELKRRHPDLKIRYLCGTKDIETQIFRAVPKEDLVVIQSAPYRGATSLFNVVFLIKLFRGFWTAHQLLRTRRPRLVVGFGGHFSFPVLVAAKRLKIPTMIHEQNVVPGTANKQFVRFADAVALSFEETMTYLPAHANMRVTGNPIRSMIERECRREALEYFGFSKDKVTVLVLGGSQGAESINQFYLAAIKFMSREMRRSIQVLHLCGRMSPAEAESASRSSGVFSKAYAFFDRMDLAYAVTDFSLGRAGATFLAEIQTKKIPAILVPYPFGGGHQLENARVFCRGNDSVIIEQQDMDVSELARLMEKHIQKAQKQKSQAALVSFAKDRQEEMNGKNLSNARKEMANFIEVYLGQ